MIPEDSVVADLFEALREMGSLNVGESALFEDFDDGFSPGLGAAMSNMRDAIRDTTEETVREVKQQAGEMTESVVAVFRSPRASDTIAPERAAFDRKNF